MADKLVLEIDLDQGSIKKSFKKVEDQSDKSGKESGSRFSKSFSKALNANVGKALGGITKTIGAASAAIAGFGVVAARAAIQQEDSINKLNIALASSGQFTEEASKGFQDFASQLQQTSRFGDEVILQNAALLQSLGRLSADGLKDATQAAADLATGLGVDLRTAATLVGRAAAGEVGTFSRYGLAIQKGASDSETFANALAAINRNFGGAAAADVQTFGGAVEQLSNNFGDLIEEFGRFVIRSPVFTGIVSDINAGILNFIKVLSGPTFAASFQSFISGLVGIGQAFNDFVVIPFEFGIQIVGKFVDSAINAFDAVAGRAKQAAGLLGSALSAIGVDNSFTESLNQLGEEGEAELIAVGATWKQIIDDSLDFPSAIKVQETLDRITELNEAVIPPLTETSNQIRNAVEPIGESFKASFKIAKEATIDASNAIKGAAVRGISTGIQQISKSLVEGTFSFKEFASSVLTIIADMIIKIGESAIATGIAIEAIGKLSGTQAIIAGAGLIALGTIIKSFIGGGAGGLGAGGSASGSGGGVAAGVTGETTTVEAIDETEERAEPETRIAINIQGDVLDSEETGLRLAALIDDAVRREGAIITGIA